MQWKPNPKQEGSRMKLIFVSMPYSAPTPEGILANIQAAEKVSIELVKCGWAVYTPHKNTAGYEQYENEDGITINTWYNLDLEILRRCDAIYLGPGWEKSIGAKNELKAARKWELAIYDYRDGYPEG